MKDLSPILLVFAIPIVILLVIAADRTRNPEHDFSYRTFDGHEYVTWHSGYRGGIAHSPKCRCRERGGVGNEAE
jgi:hypothetical protein